MVPNVTFRLLFQRRDRFNRVCLSVHFVTAPLHLYVESLSRILCSRMMSVGGSSVSVSVSVSVSASVSVTSFAPGCCLWVGPQSQSQSQPQSQSHPLLQDAVYGWVLSPSLSLSLSLSVLRDNIFSTSHNLQQFETQTHVSIHTRCFTPWPI